MARKSIRPSNKVQVGSNQRGRVVKLGRHRQGGAWVRTYRVKFADTDAIRNVRGHLVRPGV
ncbi:hypothetical protein SEA_GALACTICA_105 [Streptomyces phage Galactica]|nr:hypothetical protein SEA_GALACTICA_105 [Streptomyces phage Galactica]